MNIIKPELYASLLIVQLIFFSYWRKPKGDIKFIYM